MSRALDAFMRKTCSRPKESVDTARYACKKPGMRQKLPRFPLLALFLFCLSASQAQATICSNPLVLERFIHVRILNPELATTILGEIPADTKGSDAVTLDRSSPENFQFNFYGKAAPLTSNERRQVSLKDGSIFVTLASEAESITYRLSFDHRSFRRTLHLDLIPQDTNAEPLRILEAQSGLEIKM
jgi:hypothetical protein